MRTLLGGLPIDRGNPGRGGEYIVRVGWAYIMFLFGGARAKGSARLLFFQNKSRVRNAPFSRPQGKEKLKCPTGEKFENRGPKKAKSL